MGEQRIAALSHVEVDKLATYNAEVYRGLVHTDEKRAEMAELQRRFDTAGWLPRRRRKLMVGGPRSV